MHGNRHGQWLNEQLWLISTMGWAEYAHGKVLYPAARLLGELARFLDRDSDEHARLLRARLLQARDRACEHWAAPLVEVLRQHVASLSSRIESRARDYGEWSRLVRMLYPPDREIRVPRRFVNPPLKEAPADLTPDWLKQLRRVD